MIRELVLGVGLTLFLPTVWGLDGVLFSMPISDICTFFVSVIVIAKTYKALDAKSGLKTLPFSAAFSQ
jgi:Na+-driven multidrug efflux pump